MAAHGKSVFLRNTALSNPLGQLTAALALLCALSVNAQIPLPHTRLLLTDPGTGPEDRDVPFLAWHEDLSADGYVEREYLMWGDANTYEYVDEAAQSPLVRVATAGEPYKTRILMRRPRHIKDFNGVVYLEILNATARYDGAPMWNLTYPSIMEDGAAWVGVTYSDGTASFMRDGWGIDAFPAPAGAQPRNRSRYASLNITTRAHTWDIVNQAAALLKADTYPRNPMQGFNVDKIIVTGYSQSAAYVITQSNSFYPCFTTAPCYSTEPGHEPIVDGFIVAAGGPNSRKMDGAKSHPFDDARAHELAFAKTFRYTTESDIGSVTARKSLAEAPLLRTYEAAGTSHVDYWGRQVGNAVGNYQFGVSGEGDNACILPYNPLRTGIPLSAIQHRLARWLQFNEEPPPSHLIEVTGSYENENAPDEDLTPLAWVRDTDGNVVGGIRPPRIDVPLGNYLGANLYSGPRPHPDWPSPEEIFCTGIIGGFDAFDATELEARYTNRTVFTVLTWWNVWLAYLDGFMLPVDAKTIMDEAKDADFSGLPE